MRQIFLIPIFLFVSIWLVKPYGLQAQSVDAITRYVQALASEEMQGRGVDGIADLKAAKYIRDAFAKEGLELLFNDGFQTFSLVKSVRAGSFNSLKMDEVQLEYGKAYSLYAFSANTYVNAPVVFAGFGIVMHNDTMVRDDYKGLDVKGKWVLVLRGEPLPERSDSPFLLFSDARTKAMLARDRGAVGLIVTSGKRNNPQDELAPLVFERSVSDVGIAVIDLKREFADKTILKGTIGADSLEGLAMRGQHPISSIQTMVEANTVLEKQFVNTNNVVAALHASVPTNEWLVIGAHYDHLGFGGPGSGSRMPDTTAIHYGADDNASGVAGLIWLAGHLHSQRDKLRRNVLFAAFGAEELGLIGSRYLVRNLPVPKQDIVAMINLDMIGRLNEKNALMVGGTGTSPIWEEMLNRNNTAVGLNLAFSPEGFGASDHASFYAEGIPVLFFTTGAHSDYHTPNDTPDKINYQGMAKVLELIGAVSLELTSGAFRPVFTEAGPRERTQSRRGFKVTFGIMPGFTDTGGNGLSVDGVTKGGPADLAGMKRGDRITGINGLPVKDIYDYMNRLKTLKPGERVNVDIVRDNEPMILVVDL